MGLWAYVGLCVQSESSSPKQPESTAWEQPECISESLWDQVFLHLSGPIWTHLGQCGHIWACSGLSGHMWPCWGPSGPIWAIWDYLGLCGPIGDYLGLSPRMAVKGHSGLGHRCHRNVSFNLRCFLLEYTSNEARERPVERMQAKLLCSK